MTTYPKSIATFHEGWACSELKDNWLSLSLPNFARSLCNSRQWVTFDDPLLLDRFRCERILIAFWSLKWSTKTSVMIWPHSLFFSVLICVVHKIVIFLWTMSSGISYCVYTQSTMPCLYLGFRLWKDFYRHFADLQISLRTFHNDIAKMIVFLLKITSGIFFEIFNHMFPLFCRGKNFIAIIEGLFKNQK